MSLVQRKNKELLLKKRKEEFKKKSNRAMLELL
jgi:hypothetical protein